MIGVPGPPSVYSSTRKKGKMDFKDLFKKGKEELIFRGMGKMIEWLDDYKKAITVMETFGFTVGKLNVEMGLPPEIQTSIFGSIEKIQIDKLNKLIEENKGEAFLVALLRSLVLTRQIWESLDLKITGVILRVTLGVPPKIDAEIY
jgi:hypothetical protein